MEERSLIAAAKTVRLNAYAPYSQFLVGAALLTESGEIFTGCNVENISYGLTICAERVALGAAVAQGHKAFHMIAIVADTASPVSPCGACRQVMAEFAPDLKIVLTNLQGGIERFTMADLLPRAKTGILEKP